VFVTSQGSLHGQFQRAIQRGNFLAAEGIARDLGGLTLPDALEFLGLIDRPRPNKLEPAALRWHGRLEVEARRLNLPESLYALVAVSRLPADPETITSLRKLLRQSAPAPKR
jgi:hypothetical protein